MAQADATFGGPGGSSVFVGDCVVWKLGSRTVLVDRAPGEIVGLSLRGGPAGSTPRAIVSELETLISELSSEDEARAARALSQIPQHSEPALEFLLNLLASPDPDQRWWAIMALSSIDDP